MPDYQCQCKGPFGTARYTVKEASAKDFRCPICNTQIVEVKNTPVGAEHYTVIDDDDVQIAPGVNANDERFSDAVKEPEGLDMAKWDERHKERVRQNQQTLTSAIPWTFSTPTVPYHVETIELKDPDVRIRYAHGIEYAFDYDELPDGVVESLEEWMTQSYRSRKSKPLVFNARGRIFILNPELVAGIDFLD